MSELDGGSPDGAPEFKADGSKIIPFPGKRVDRVVDHVGSMTIINNGLPITVEQYVVDTIIEAMGDQGEMRYPRKSTDGHVIPLRVLTGGVDTEAKGE